MTSFKLFFTLALVSTLSHAQDFSNDIDYENPDTGTPSDVTTPDEAEGDVINDIKVSACDNYKSLTSKELSQIIKGGIEVEPNFDDRKISFTFSNILAGQCFIDNVDFKFSDKNIVDGKRVYSYEFAYKNEAAKDKYVKCFKDVKKNVSDTSNKNLTTTQKNDLAKYKTLSVDVKLGSQNKSPYDEFTTDIVLLSQGKNVRDLSGNSAHGIYHKDPGGCLVYENADRGASKKYHTKSDWKYEVATAEMYEEVGEACDAVDIDSMLGFLDNDSYAPVHSDVQKAIALIAEQKLKEWKKGNYEGDIDPRLIDVYLKNKVHPILREMEQLASGNIDSKKRSKLMTEYKKLKEELVKYFPIDYSVGMKNLIMEKEQEGDFGLAKQLNHIVAISNEYRNLGKKINGVLITGSMVNGNIESINEQYDAGIEQKQKFIDIANGNITGESERYQELYDMMYQQKEKKMSRIPIYRQKLEMQAMDNCKNYRRNYMLYQQCVGRERQKNNVLIDRLVESYNKNDETMEGLQKDIQMYQNLEMLAANGGSSVKSNVLYNNISGAYMDPTGYASALLNYNMSDPAAMMDMTPAMMNDYNLRMNAAGSYDPWAVLSQQNQMTGNGQFDFSMADNSFRSVATFGEPQYMGYPQMNHSFNYHQPNNGFSAFSPYSTGMQGYRFR